MAPIPVIDLFAGPGGLGEGFCRAGYDIRLSIEKDPIARLTLQFRALCRLITAKEGRSAVVGAFKSSDPQSFLMQSFPRLVDEAGREAWCATLGQTSATEVSSRIKAALGDADDWVLLGGPPCQAYSLVGRSRMRTTRLDFDNDHRHFLYREYLRIVADHAPPVFLMENVKGLLSARNKGVQMITRILDDLRFPRKSIGSHPFRHTNSELEYDIVPLVCPVSDLFGALLHPEHFVVRSEEHGVPQARHRVFLLGLRRDRNLMGSWRGITPKDPTTVRHAISDLPRARSGISHSINGSWAGQIQIGLHQPWFRRLKQTQPDVARALDAAASNLASSSGVGANLLPRDKRRKPRTLREWYRHDYLPVVLNHEVRSHMPSDLHRYIFASSFAEVHGRSPHLRDFPKELLPNHRNVQEASGEPIFDDRFRVQCWDLPSSTVMSHISKDGHYYIHPDPTQCRSLTVREAARLQTFPDDYLFCGPRTQQFLQVGNAVPPYLAYQIASAIKTSLFNHA